MTTADDEQADAAIDELSSGAETRSSPLVSAVLDGGTGFTEACNVLSLRVARRLVNGEIPFEAADGVMNWVWTRIIEWMIEECEEPPEPAYSIYDAVDRGEYRLTSEPDVDPVAQYTIPSLIKILSTSG